MIRLAVAVAAVAVLGACSSTTSGRGSDRAPASSTTSTPDFPSSTPTSSTSMPTSSSSTSSSSSSPTSTTSPVPSSPLRTATVHGQHATYVLKVWARVHTPTCVDHAYGTPVIDFLKDHPCSGLDRTLATTVVAGRPVGFAQSSLGFVGVAPRVYEVAGAFRQLVTREGTGNLTDLLRAGYRLPAGPGQVPSPDAFSALSQDSGVTIVDAWYLDRPTPENDAALVRMARDIYLQF